MDITFTAPNGRRVEYLIDAEHSVAFSTDLCMRFLWELMEMKNTVQRKKKKLSRWTQTPLQLNANASEVRVVHHYTLNYQLH